MEDFLLSQIGVNFFLQNFSSLVIQFMKWVTFLGEEYFYMIFLPLLYWCIDSRAGFRVGAMLMFSNGIVNGFKMAIHSPRPYWLDNGIFSYAQETSFGIPSGHTTNAASVWGILAHSYKKRWFTILVIFVIFLIGISRLFLGVHFFIDVISGWFLGVCLLIIFIRFEKPITAWFGPLELRHKIFVAFFSSVMILLPAFIFSWLMGNWTIPNTWISNAGHPIEPLNPEGSFTAAGTWAGLLIGASWFKHKYGQFSSGGKFFQRVLRYGLGLVGVIVIWFGLDQIFPDGADSIGMLLRYVRYGAVGFWVTGFAPLLFIKLRLTSIAQPKDV